MSQHLESADDQIKTDTQLSLGLIGIFKHLNSGCDFFYTGTNIKLRGPISLFYPRFKAEYHQNATWSATKEMGHHSIKSNTIEEILTSYLLQILNPHLWQLADWPWETTCQDKLLIGIDDNSTSVAPLLNSVKYSGTCIKKILQLM